MGWFAVDAEWWPVAAEGMAQPWSREAACIDLRWWVDGKGRPPSRRKLAARWGWTDGQVRWLLRNPGEWWDAAKGDVPELAAPRPGRGTQAGPNNDQAGPKDSPAAEGQTPNINAPGPNNDQAGPSGDHTRTYHNTLTLTLEEPSASKADGWTECHDLWRRLHQNAVGRMPPKLTRGKGIGQAMGARIREHSSEAVQAVMRWFWLSDDASWHREHSVGLRTLMRPQKFDGYLERAASMGPPEPPPKGDQEALKARRARMIEAARQQQRDKTRALRERSQTTGGPRG